jgi:hydroxyacylglutathione hydrolase
MKVHVLTVGMFQSNCYVPCCESTGEAILIDPGDEGERIVSFIEKKKLDVKFIVNTHAHIDHVSALNVVTASLHAPVLLHEADRFIFDNLAYQGTLYGLDAPKGIVIDRYLKDGDEIAFGNEKLRVIHTPGHSPGSVALLADGARPNIVFSGDTLFSGSIGRTDLFGGSFDQIMESLRTAFLSLPDDTIVYPGHGESSTVGEEKLHNPFMLQIR